MQKGEHRIKGRLVALVNSGLLNTLAAHIPVQTQAWRDVSRLLPHRSIQKQGSLLGQRLGLVRSISAAASICPEESGKAAPKLNCS